MRRYRVKVDVHEDYYYEVEVFAADAGEAREIAEERVEEELLDDPKAEKIHGGCSVQATSSEYIGDDDP